MTHHKSRVTHTRHTRRHTTGCVSHTQDTLHTGRVTHSTHACHTHKTHYIQDVSHTLHTRVTHTTHTYITHYIQDTCHAHYRYVSHTARHVSHTHDTHTHTHTHTTHCIPDTCHIHCGHVPHTQDTLQTRVTGRESHLYALKHCVCCHECVRLDKCIHMHVHECVCLRTYGLLTWVRISNMYYTRIDVSMFAYAPHTYSWATVSRIDQIIGLFCRISSLL